MKSGALFCEIAMAAEEKMEEQGKNVKRREGKKEKIAYKTRRNALGGGKIIEMHNI